MSTFSDLLISCPGLIEFIVQVCILYLVQKERGKDGMAVSGEEKDRASEKFGKIESPQAPLPGTKVWYSAVSIFINQAKLL